MQFLLNNEIDRVCGAGNCFCTDDENETDVRYCPAFTRVSTSNECEDFCRKNGYKISHFNSDDERNLNQYWTRSHYDILHENAFIGYYFAKNNDLSFFK